MAEQLALDLDLTGPGPLALITPDAHSGWWTTWADLQPGQRVRLAAHAGWWTVQRLWPSEAAGMVDAWLVDEQGQGMGTHRDTWAAVEIHPDDITGKGQR